MFEAGIAADQPRLVEPILKIAEQEFGLLLHKAAARSASVQRFYCAIRPVGEPTPRQEFQPAVTL
jgi:hypothetical protein